MLPENGPSHLGRSSPYHEEAGATLTAFLVAAHTVVSTRAFFAAALDATFTPDMEDSIVKECACVCVCVGECA